MADYGSVRPLGNIAEAEKQHIDALVELFEHYDLAVPENDWSDQVASYDSLQDACEAGVQAEVENAELFDELFSMVDNADIEEVFTSLQRASQENHPSAFERCAVR